MKNPSTSTTFIVKLLLSLTKATILVAAVAVSWSVQSTPALAANPLMGQEAAIIARTNQIRAEAGLPALVVNQSLAISAVNKANDMATKGYFAHANPDGQRMGYWIGATGYVYSLAGENLAKGYSSLDRLMNAWVTSPSHYKNLVEPKFTQIGIGMAEGWYENQPTLFIVQHFAAEVAPVVNEINELTGVATLVSPLLEGVVGTTDAQAGVSQPTPVEPPVTVLSDSTAAKLNQAESSSLISRHSSLALARIAQASALEPLQPPMSDQDQTPINWLVVLIVVGFAAIIHIGIDRTFWLNVVGKQPEAELPEQK